MDIAAGCLVFCYSHVSGLKRQLHDNLTDRAGTPLATLTKEHTYAYTPMATELGSSISTTKLHLRNH
jgi:hypothetical protein